MPLEDGKPFYRKRRSPTHPPGWRRALNWIDREPDPDAITAAIDEIMAMVTNELQNGIDLIPPDNDQDAVTKKATLIRLALLHRKMEKLRAIANQRRKQQGEE